MLKDYEYYIVDNGIRIGFYYHLNEIREAMEYCPSGFITTKKEWEAQGG